MADERTRQLSQHIVLTCARLHARNMLAGADGNISVRLSDDEILITPTGIAKAFMEPHEMAVINLAGDILSGKPSSERWMHLQILRQCPQAMAVVHAHPPTAIAWSIARPDLDELPCDCLSEVIIATGGIPFVPYARPGTADMATALQPFLPQYRAMILRAHGAVAWGGDLAEAHRGMERIEHSAQILARAAQLGTLHALPAEELDHLRALRKSIGEVLL
jgi:L-fuculose-phosphate aldolase